MHWRHFINQMRIYVAACVRSRRIRSSPPKLWSTHGAPAMSLSWAELAAGRVSVSHPYTSEASDPQDHQQDFAEADLALVSFPSSLLKPSRCHTSMTKISTIICTSKSRILNYKRKLRTYICHTLGKHNSFEIATDKGLDYSLHFIG
jgi:hypothetical protein